MKFERVERMRPRYLVDHYPICIEKYRIYADVVEKNKHDAPIVQRGKIEYYAREGKDTPAGMVIAHDGSTMTDSEEILKALVNGTAALAPLGGIGDELAGYKGYGYAAVVEILSAALSGGKFMKALTGVDENGAPRMYSLGHFFFVVNPEAFMGEAEFRKIAGDICRALRASQKAQPSSPRTVTASRSRTRK